MWVCDSPSHEGVRDDPGFPKLRLAFATNFAVPPGDARCSDYEKNLFRHVLVFWGLFCGWCISLTLCSICCRSMSENLSRYKRCGSLCLEGGVMRKTGLW